MPTGTKAQMTTQVNDSLLTWIEGFLVDRKARGLTDNKLKHSARCSLNVRAPLCRHLLRYHSKEMQKTVVLC